MKKHLLSILIALLGIGYAAAQAPIEPYVTNRTIFVPVGGSATVDPIIGDGLIRVDNYGTLSFIDLDGKYVYGEESKLRAGGSSYDNTRGRFSGGVAMVTRDGKHTSIIFTDRHYLDLPDTYTKVSGFIDGIAMAEKPSGFNKASCFINQFGKEVLPSLSVGYSYCSDNFYMAPMSEGLRAFFDPGGKLWGYADAAGKIVIKPQFAHALPFSDGLAAVCVKENYKELWGFVNKQGQMQIPAIYTAYPGSFSEGLAPVKNENSKMVFIDKTGKVVSPEFYECNSFKDGYAFVNMAYGESAVIDRSFNTVKKFDYNSSFEMPKNNATKVWGFSFRSGLAAVRTYGGVGVIFNPKGDVVYTSKEAYDFHDGHLAKVFVKLGRKYYQGFINKAGELAFVFVAVGSKVIVEGETADGEIVEIPKSLYYPDGKGGEPENAQEDGKRGSASGRKAREVPKAEPDGKYTRCTLGQPVPRELVCIGLPPIIPGPGKLPETGGSGISTPESRKSKLTVTVVPEEAAEVKGAGEYLEKEQVMLSLAYIYPNRYKYTFERWEDASGKNLGDQTTIHYTMPAQDAVLKAIYRENAQFTVMALAEPAEYGRVEEPSQRQYHENEPMDMKAIANEGCDFNGWWDPETQKILSSSTLLDIKMPARNMALTARFSKEESIEDWALITCSDKSDAVMSGMGRYKPGTEVTVSVEVSGADRFKGWYLGDALISKDPTFKYKTGNRTVVLVAQFESAGADAASGGGGTLIGGFANEFGFSISAQSITGFATTAAPVKFPAAGYLEIHERRDIPTQMAGDVLGILYFDFEPVKMPDDIRDAKDSQGRTYGDEYNDTMSEYLPLYFSPLYIFRHDDKYIYAMGEGFTSDKKSLGFRSTVKVYRFEYGFDPKTNGVALGKYQEYRHSVEHVDGQPMNKYAWVNPGIEENPTDRYISEPDKENRYMGVSVGGMYKADQSAPIPEIARPDMLLLLDKSLKHPKAVDIGYDSWSKMIKDLTRGEYAKLYNNLYENELPEGLTASPLRIFE